MSFLKVGDKAPDFQLKNQREETICLDSYRHKSNIVLYFYPKASTPGCTVQACSLRDTYADFKNLNTEIIGISPDLSKKLLNFENKQNLNFNLLSDPEHKIAETYGVWGLKKFMGREFMGIIRSTFIIDKSGIIRHVMPKVNTKTHHEDALLWIKENNL